MTFLIRSSTSQSSSYPIVLTRLGGPRSRSNPYLKLWNCRESIPRPHGQQSDTLNPRPMRRSMFLYRFCNVRLDIVLQMSYSLMVPNISLNILLSLVSCDKLLCAIYRNQLSNSFTLIFLDNFISLCKLCHCFSLVN